MATERSVVDGVLVGTVDRTYEAFTDDRTGREVKGGRTLAVWVARGIEDEPVKVKVPDPRMFAQATADGYLEPVRLLCELRPAGRGFDRRLVEVLPVVDLEGV